MRLERCRARSGVAGHPIHDDVGRRRAVPDDFDAPQSSPSSPIAVRPQKARAHGLTVRPCFTETCCGYDDFFVSQLFSLQHVELAQAVPSACFIAH
jgi:hypothetical protein